LFDPFQASACFLSFNFEAADSRGFLKNEASFAGRRLEQGVDFSLFDDAVGTGRNSGAGEDIADVS